MAGYRVMLTNGLESQMFNNAYEAFAAYSTLDFVPTLAVLTRGEEKHTMTIEEFVNWVRDDWEDDYPPMQSENQVEPAVTRVAGRYPYRQAMEKGMQGVTGVVTRQEDGSLHVRLDDENNLDFWLELTIDPGQ